MYSLFENWRHYLNEELIDQLSTKDSNGNRIMSSNTLSKIFKYFHISISELNRDQPFTFTPRVPSSPYGDINGNTIEDDFTNRVSLAPSVDKAIEALELDPSEVGDYELYAIDFLEINDDNIKSVDLKAHLNKCPHTSDMPYNSNFSMKKWLLDKGENIPKIKNRIGVGPSNLPEKWKNQFYGCVPDAGKTSELWAVYPIKMYHIGRLLNSNNISLSRNGSLVIDRYLNKLSDNDEKEEA